MSESKQGSGWLALLPILFGFYVMGFVDIIGTATAYIKSDYNLSDQLASFLPSMIFMWFFLVSVPASLMLSKFGRKNTVMISLVITVIAMFLPMLANKDVASTKYIYFAAFALMGIGNTIIQAALPSLMSNVVEQDQLTSRISLGQFVKALCAAASPFIATFAAKQMGNWKLIFPIYGGLTILSAVWLMATPIKREDATAAGATFGSCLSLLGNPYILAMFFGIFFSVGADVGFGFSIPPFMKDACGLTQEDAVRAGSVYFIAKTIGSFLGAAIFAKIAPRKCFPWSLLIAIAGVVAMLFTRNAAAVLTCIFIASLGLSNTFGMAFGLAMNRLPAKANEISGLMVMAIAGGAVIPPIMGAVQSKSGPNGLIFVILGCCVYMLILGIFAAKQNEA